MLRNRVLNSLLIMLLTGLVVFLFPNWAYCALVVFFVGTALHEFFSIVEKKGVFVYKYFGIIAGVLVPIMIYLQLGEGYANLEPFFIVLASLFTFVLQFIRRENTSDHLASIAITLLPLFYVSWFFSFFIKIKFLSGGPLLVSFLVLVTKSGDVAAYLVGKKFGKHSLIPRISPKKTVEGTMGAFAASLVTALLCKFFLKDFGYQHLVILGILLGTLGQVGDLAESLLKRDCGVKDSGAAISGLGGILDIIDSLLFTTPIFYFYLKIVMLK